MQSLINPFKRWFVLGLFLTFPYTKLPALERPYDEFVSLGTACQTAWQLKINLKRNTAYPFDWLITPCDALISFIENEGKGFLEKENLEILEPLSHDSTILRVIDNAYKIIFLHDFFPPSNSKLEEVKRKYEKRTQRFFNLLNSDKKISGFE